MHAGINCVCNVCGSCGCVVNLGQRISIIIINI